MKVKYIFILFFFLFATPVLKAQTPLTEAVDFHVKTLDGDPYYLFQLLDEGKIVVIDFFSTSCGPCQEYAPDFQQAYEEFGENESNVFFMGINWGDDNDGVYEFDSVFGLTYPTVSGIQGGGNYVYEDYEIITYPTVIIITPDHQIVNQYVWPPTADSIINAVLSAGGLYLGLNDHKNLSAEQIEVFPNPASKAVHVKFDLALPSTVRIDLVDLAGNTFFRSHEHSFGRGKQSIQLPLEGMTNGFYFVRYSVNNRLVAVKSLVIAH